LLLSGHLTSPSARGVSDADGWPVADGLGGGDTGVVGELGADGVEQLTRAKTSARVARARRLMVEEYARCCEDPVSRAVDRPRFAGRHWLGEADRWLAWLVEVAPTRGFDKVSHRRP